MKTGRRLWLTVLGWIAIGLSMIVFAGMAFLRTSWDTYQLASDKPYDLETVTVVRPEWVVLLNASFALAIVVLFGVGVVAFCQRKSLLSGLAFASISLAPVAIFTAFLREGPPWQIHNEIRDQDGTCYCFAESSFLQGQSLMLGRLRSGTRWTRTYDVLVETNGDSPRSYLRIVRPSGAEEKYGQLYLTDDGWLLGLRSENRCFFAYDTKRQLPYGHTEVEELSPFLALGQASELHEPDVVDLTARMGGKELRVSTADSVRKGLDHPNPRVRAISSQLLGPNR